MTRQTHGSGAEKLPPYLTDRKRRLQRRKMLGPVVARAKASRASKKAQTQAASWTDEEKQVLLPFCERVKKKQCSAHGAVVEVQKILPDRSYEAIRKKIKNRVNYGVWM